MMSLDLGDVLRRGVRSKYYYAAYSRKLRSTSLRRILLGPCAHAGEKLLRV